MEHCLHTLYYSKQCPHCIQILNQLTDIKRLDSVIDKKDVSREDIPNNIKSVPSLMVNNQNLLSGKDVFIWLEREKESSVNAFEEGFGNSTYSYVDTDGLASNQQSFTFLENFGNENTQNEQTSKDSRLEQFMAARDQEVPRAIQRT